MPEAEAMFMRDASLYTSIFMQIIIFATLFVFIYVLIKRVIINNLKGIFFDDDDFEHMSCCIDACWGKIGMTEIRICDHRDLKKCEIFR